MEKSNVILSGKNMKCVEIKEYKIRTNFITVKDSY